MTGRAWFLRVAVDMPKEERPEMARAREFWKAVETLREVIPHLQIEALEGCHTGGGLSTAQQNAELLEDVTRSFRGFGSALSAVARHVPYVNVSDGDCEWRFDWLLEAEILHLAFTEAMLISEPDKEFGLSHEGPAVRFIKVGLKLLTGLDVNEAAIKKRLERARNNRDN